MSETEIILFQKKHYGCFRKFFCCKCIYCCQSMDFSLLTSENRKKTFSKMVRNYINTLNKQKQIIVDPFFVLLALLLGEQSEIYQEMIGRLNGEKPNRSVFSKEDLSFYMPELCTYLVFHEQMNNKQMFNLMQRACKIDINFSFGFYFYLRSLEVTEDQVHSVVRKYNRQFIELIKNQFKIKIERQQNLYQDVIAAYHNRKQTDQKIIYEKVQELFIYNIYQQTQQSTEEKSQNQSYFQSHIQFFDDIMDLSRNLIKSENRKQMLFKNLKVINKKLPAAICIPFPINNIQGKTILNIIFEECKVFKTKERAPIYLCMQVYSNPIQCSNQQVQDDIVKSINKSKRLRRSTFFQQDAQVQNRIDNEIEIRQTRKYCKTQQNEESVDAATTDRATRNKKYFSKIQVEQEQPQKKHKNFWNDLYRMTHKAKQLMGTQQKFNEQNEQNEKQEQQDEDDTIFIFGQSQAQQLNRVKKISPYGNLPGYTLAHLIFKTNDNLTQEAFAMQLLQQFDNIFKMQKIPILLVPYQVIPLSHQSGVIQLIKDAVTIDQLRKKQASLQFIAKDKTKLKNFIRSLAGYSLITYLLQVKDRHNGNIMIHKDGRIFHIDYGFFISNAPGVQIQKNVAFKLTNQYIQILGGMNSRNFAEFRKLFYQGYNACRKHQHRIIILIKLMYSSFGKTMPCFALGDEAIQNLQQRFNPAGIKTDADLSLFCQNLINSNVDNWRARWYDKWQYYVQGIFY